MYYTNFCIFFHCNVGRYLSIFYSTDLVVYLILVMNNCIRLYVHRLSLLQQIADRQQDTSLSHDPNYFVPLTLLLSDGRSLRERRQVNYEHFQFIC